jgi:signal transduction histidine kinase
VPDARLIHLRDFAVAAAAYGLAAFASQAFRLADTSISLVWLPAGVAIAFMLRRGAWLWTVVPVVQTIVAIVEGNGAFNVGRVAAATTAATLVAWTVLRRLQFDMALARLRDAIALLIASAAGAVTGAVLNGVLRTLERGDAWGSLHRAFNWALGDITGMLLIVPLACTWGRRGARLPGVVGRGEMTALVVLLAAVAALASLVVPQGMTALVATLYLAVPLQIWGAVRIGPRGGAQAFAVTASAVLLASLTAEGIASGSAAIPLALLDGFLIVSAAATLLVAALVADHARATEALAEVRRQDAVRRLAGGVAHDFNNLLTGILGHVELIAQHGSMAEPGQIEAIRTAAQRAAAITQQLLAYGQRTLLRPVEFEVQALVLEASEQVLGLAGPGVQGRVTTDQTAPRVRTDREQLGRVLMQLGLRSAAAMGGSGTLSYHTALDAARGEVRIRVADTSPLDDATRSRPFEPYAGPLPTGEPSRRATGLELAIAHGFAQQAGGRVEVAGDAAGTAITLVLPAVT